MEDKLKEWAKDNITGIELAVYEDDNSREVARVLLNLMRILTEEEEHWDGINRILY